MKAMELLKILIKIDLHRTFPYKAPLLHISSDLNNRSHSRIYYARELFCLANLACAMWMYCCAHSLQRGTCDPEREYFIASIYLSSFSVLQTDDALRNPTHRQFFIFNGKLAIPASPRGSSC